MSTAGQQMDRLVEIMGRLRAEGGCPWDREQDLRSLRPYLIEEAFEVLEEMDRAAYGGSWRAMCEELGDLLFQIVFHAQLARELGEFGMADVCQAIADKIERRHPHVFGEKQVEGAQQVLENWAKLKAEERKRKTGREGSVLEGVPREAPALMRAERLTEKASRLGFDWRNTAEVRAKLDEELKELDGAIASGDRDALEHEVGDVLLTMVNLARFLSTPPEDALRMAIRRFTTRFQHIESALRAEGVALGEASLEDMERHWQAAKVAEKALPPPTTPPRAPLAELRLPVTELSAQQSFWDEVAPLLGWRSERGEPGEAVYGDGLHRLVFVQGATSTPSPLTLTFGAPSAEAVERLRATLETSRPGSVLAEGGGAGRMAFRDPAGIRWEYTFGSR
jgi:nucleoside triphosphate diphosphatase